MTSVTIAINKGVHEFSRGDRSFRIHQSGGGGNCDTPTTHTVMLP
jgi:hypothetical protein